MKTACTTEIVAAITRVYLIGFSSHLEWQGGHQMMTCISQEKCCELVNRFDRCYL